MGTEQGPSGNFAPTKPEGCQAEAFTYLGVLPGSPEGAAGGIACRIIAVQCGDRYGGLSNVHPSVTQRELGETATQLLAGFCIGCEHRMGNQAAAEVQTEQPVYNPDLVQWTVDENSQERLPVPCVSHEALKAFGENLGVEGKKQTTGLWTVLEKRVALHGTKKGETVDLTKYLLYAADGTLLGIRAEQLQALLTEFQTKRLQLRTLNKASIGMLANVQASLYLKEPSETPEDQ